MGSYIDHQNLIGKFKIDIQKEIKGIRLFDRHVGKFILTRFIKDYLSGKCKFSDWKRYLISINFTGMADCYAMMPTKFGIMHIEFEFKTGSARQSKEQKTWQKYIENNNGIYMVIREDYDNSIQELKNRVNRLIN